MIWWVQLQLNLVQNVVTNVRKQLYQAPHLLISKQVKAKYTYSFKGKCNIYLTSENKFIWCHSPFFSNLKEKLLFCIQLLQEKETAIKEKRWTMCHGKRWNFLSWEVAMKTGSPCANPNNIPPQRELSIYQPQSTW